MVSSSKSTEIKELEMKTIYESESTPKKDGFYMPGEYEEQERTWILWPHRSDVWRCGAKPAQKVFTEIDQDRCTLSAHHCGRQHRRLPRGVRDLRRR